MLLYMLNPRNHMGVASCHALNVGIDEIAGIMLGTYQ